MRTLIAAMAVTGAIAGTIGGSARAQDVAPDASPDMAGLLEALTCSEFLQLDAQNQMTVMLAMRASLNGEPLPDEPLPIGLEAEVGGADGLGGASGNASGEGPETDGASGAEAVEAMTQVMDEADGQGEGAEGTDVPDDTGVVDGENESGKVAADGTEASVTDEPADPKLTGMRTSCEGGPEALASNAMLAAHADYE